MGQSKKKHSLKIQNKTIEFVEEDLVARTFLFNFQNDFLYPVF